MRIYNDTVPANNDGIENIPFQLNLKCRRTILFQYGPARDSSNCLTNQVFWSYQKVEA